MRNALKKRVQSIQKSMVELATPYFSKSDLGDLRILIRITMEFKDFVKNGNPDLRKITKQFMNRIPGDVRIDMKDQELAYVNESTFSGFDSFWSVNGMYRILTGAMKSKINWGEISVLSLKRLFVRTYRKFEAEPDFLRKCRLLLDLFKIQIVFIGVSYS